MLEIHYSGREPSFCSAHICGVFCSCTHYVDCFFFLVYMYVVFCFVNLCGVFCCVGMECVLLCWYGVCFVVYTNVVCCVHMVFFEYMFCCVYIMMWCVLLMCFSVFC